MLFDAVKRRRACNVTIIVPVSSPGGWTATVTGRDLIYIS
jgi:hypothetical protein